MFYNNWDYSVYDEQDWSKLQNMDIRELLGERTKLANACQAAKCLSCPDFLKHVGLSEHTHTNN